MILVVLMVAASLLVIGKGIAEGVILLAAVVASMGVIYSKIIHPMTRFVLETARTIDGLDTRLTEMDRKADEQAESMNARIGQVESHIGSLANDDRLAVRRAIDASSIRRAG